MQVVADVGLTWAHAHSNLASVVRPPSISCVTMLAPPVERLSRCFSTLTKQSALPLLQLTPVQIAAALPVARTHLGVGCLNELARTFSGFQDETLLSKACTRTPSSPTC